MRRAAATWSHRPRSRPESPALTGYRDGAEADGRLECPLLHGAPPPSQVLAVMQSDHSDVHAAGHSVQTKLDSGQPDDVRTHASLERDRRGRSTCGGEAVALFFAANP